MGLPHQTPRQKTQLHHPNRLGRSGKRDPEILEYLNRSRSKNPGKKTTTTFGSRLECPLIILGLSLHVFIATAKYRLCWTL
ncbi:hypothetical protein GDO81_028386 [Engystomops pustulosus]|uniref:Uncharacterized protein n=1 Tax=Engystomops pustulosus TaxID=76066 RepID=A0AAV6ZP84_ENGPU|nr:hypothetical protein GDO81_028386 [Engystomops pustulosus]